MPSDQNAKSLHASSQDVPKRVALRVAVASCMEKWFRAAQKAAVEGDIAAQSLLGQMLMSGYGTEQDTVQGVYWLQKAADGDDPDAKKMLASLVPGGGGIGDGSRIEQLSAEDDINT